MALLLLLVAVTGACTMGAQNISYSFVSQYCPSFMRSTAIGLASGSTGWARLTMERPIKPSRTASGSRAAS